MRNWWTGAALLLALGGCGGEAAPDELAQLDRDLAANSAGANDPAVRAALADQIMVDPALVQQANADAVRPPPRPVEGALPAVDIAGTPPPAPGPVTAAPPASGACPDCAAAKTSLTLAELAARQRDRVAGHCAPLVEYAAGWASRLPAEFPLYPGARLAEAAGTNRDGCALRAVSFTAAAAPAPVLDWYYTQAKRAGYSAAHAADGALHALGGSHGDGRSYMIYVKPHADGGSEVDLLVNARR